MDPNDQTPTSTEPTEPTEPAAEPLEPEPDEPVEPAEPSDARVPLDEDPEYQKLVKAGAKKLFKQWKRKHKQRESGEPVAEPPAAPQPPVQGPGQPAETTGKRPMSFNRFRRWGR